MTRKTAKTALPIKIYRRVLSGPKGKRESDTARFLTKFHIFLKDRPGSLAHLASLISRHSGNISFFHYNRSVDANRVVVEVQFSAGNELETLLQSLDHTRYTFEKREPAREEIQITAVENILEIKVKLANKPGTLAAFAHLLKKHDANVAYMLYDEDIDPESANVVLATKSSEEINTLLGAMNERGYAYRVLYRGADEEKVDRVIGLKLIEKFFLRLKKLLPDRDRGEIKTLVDSSQELHSDLVGFYSEAGSDLASAEIFENVLALASISVTRTGERFAARTVPPLAITKRVQLHIFRMPTSENVFVFSDGDDLTMIDAGYGVYYENIKSLLREKGLKPENVRRIFLTHPDADHMGSARYFHKEFGARICLHPASRSVIKSSNRAYGADNRLSRLNRYFTRLVNRFTDSEYPKEATYFSTPGKGRISIFPVIDTFAVGDITCEVLESRGGHIPGQVFFLERDHGLCFTADYLINVQSLSVEDVHSLNVYKYLLTSTNSDSRLFRQETSDLREMITAVDRKLRQGGKTLLVLPGHGDHYTAEMLQE